MGNSIEELKIHAAENGYKEKKSSKKKNPPSYQNCSISRS